MNTRNTLAASLSLVAIASIAVVALQFLDRSLNWTWDDDENDNEEEWLGI